MLTDKITNKKKDPLGRMLLDYFAGQLEVSLEVESADVDIWTMTGATLFRDFAGMDHLERTALSHCTGRVVDVGAGSGCHTLFLQSRGLEVDALDISPGCVEVMQKRGVMSCVHQNLFALRERKYETVLMLMNGLGICGSVDGLNLFFQFIGSLLSAGGQIIADSTDMYRRFGLPAELPVKSYPGETEFVMRYKNLESDPFPWIYVDFDLLRTLAELQGLSCQCLLMEDDGRYLARISSE